MRPIRKVHSSTPPPKRHFQRRLFTSNQPIRSMSSLLEHQIHQNIIYTSNRRHSIHINKNSSIGLIKTFLQSGVVKIDDVLHAHRAGLKGKGAGGNFHWRAPIAYFTTSSFVKFVFAVSQRSRLLFPVVDYVPADITCFLAAFDCKTHEMVLKINVSCPCF